MRPEGGCRPEIRPPGKRCRAAAPKLSSQLHKQGCDPRMGPRCCTRSPTGRQKHSSAAACSHVGQSAGLQTTAPSERCCAPGDGHYNNVAIKEQNKKRQWFAAQGPDVALSLATNWRNGPFFPPLEQLAPIRGHTMRALVSPRTPRSHHPGCPLLLPATRPDLQAEHPAAPSAELGGGTGAAERGCVRRGGTNGAAAPPRCHYNSAAPEQECAAGALEPNYPNYVDLPSRCELCRRRPRAATRTNVCLSCKKGAGAFLPPYSPQQPYFGNEKSLLSHPDITCGAQRRRGRVTDGDHTAMDAHRSQQGPTRGSARTIRLCVPLLGSPRPPQRRLPSFPSTALGQLRSPSHQLGSIGSQRIPGSKPSWRSTEPTGRAFTAPLPAAHPEQSSAGLPLRAAGRGKPPRQVGPGSREGSPG